MGKLYVVRHADAGHRSAGPARDEDRELSERGWRQAKGLAGRTTVVRHGVRNAMIPIVTIIGLQVPVLVGGSLVLEQIYGIPGVAKYLFDAIAARDFPVIIAVNMVVAVTIVVVNLVVDLTYAFLDPRVRIS